MSNSESGTASDAYNSDCQSADKHVLTPKLLAPSTVLSLLMFGLTFLPMASCGSKNDRQIIPAVMALELTKDGINNSGDNEGWLLYPKAVFGAIPLLFIFTIPYWTAVPILLILPLLWKSPRWATRLWRLLVLALALASSSFAFMDQTDWRWYLFYVVCFASIGCWLWSSPLAAWIAALGYRIFSRRRPNWRKRQTLFGGFWSHALLCFAGYFYLAMNNDLLYGGKLAALTNVSLAFALAISARQSRVDPDRSPQFNTRDLMIFTLAIALSLWRFWTI